MERAAHLVPTPGGKGKALLPEIEERMRELAAKGVLTWSGAPFQLPEPVAENRGPKLLSDLVVEDRE
jgi:hypothetical protein